jgi:tetratricopeptide (TPR) repeat protein
MLPYYLRFGRSLSDPYFSGFHSYLDGLYSTLWGDGLWGGHNRATRTPWNYELMTAGYLLAILPSLAILIGAVAGCVQLVREPRAEWFLLIGLPFAFAAALVYQYLRFPYYAHAKAFYGLTAAVSLCAFGAWGFDTLVRRWLLARYVLGTVLGTWALTAYFSFWVTYHSAPTQAWLGANWSRAGNPRLATECFQRALSADPGNVDAHIGLFRLQQGAGQTAAAREELQTALRLQPDNFEVLFWLGVLCNQSGQTDQALVYIQRSIERAPDNALGPYYLGLILQRKGLTADAIDAYRQALAITPAHATLHAALAPLLAENGDTGEAIEHYRLLLQLQPDGHSFMDSLAWILATTPQAEYRDAAQAEFLAKRACERTSFHDPTCLSTLGAAYAEAGRFAEAETELRKALELASSVGRTSLLSRIKEQLKLCKAGRPYRENPKGTAPGSRGSP